MGLRDTLRSRGLPHVTVPIRAVPSAQVAAAEAELAAATTALSEAEARKAVSTALRQRVDAAQAAVDDCYQLLTVRALPPSEMESLLAEHPATDEQRTQGAVPFNRTTFVPALLARCVFDDPDSPEPALTEQEWVEELAKGSSSLGEVGALFAACWQVNDRTPDQRIPKGSTPTSS
jgi:hypothetical protein